MFLFHRIWTRSFLRNLALVFLLCGCSDPHSGIVLAMSSWYCGVLSQLSLVFILDDIVVLALVFFHSSFGYP